MILKQTRILVGDGDAFGKYMKTLKPGEDISIEVLFGDPDLVRLNDVVAVVHKRTYGNRHIIVSPGELLSAKDLDIVIDEIRKEFDIPDESFARRVVVRHEKERRLDSAGREYHYHIAIPEVSRDGSILDIAHDYIRNEVVARKLEIMLEHEIVLGAWNPEVLDRLDTETFFIPEDAYNANIHVRVPHPVEMRLRDEFDIISAFENDDIRVSYNTEAFVRALYDACIDAGMSDDQASENYAFYRAFSGKKTAYMEAAKRLGVDLDDVRSEFSAVLNDALDASDTLDTSKSITRDLKRLLRRLDFTLTYNEPTRVMFVSAHRIIDNVRHLSRIGTLRGFLGLTQKQFEPILSEILMEDIYGTTDEKPKRYIEKSKDSRNPGLEFERLRGLTL